MRRQTLESWTIGGQSWIDSSRNAVRRVLTQLCGKLRVARLKQTHQRTLAKRRADRLDVRKFLAAPEDLEKTGALAVRAAECVWVENTSAVQLLFFPRVRRPALNLNPRPALTFLLLLFLELPSSHRPLRER